MGWINHLKARHQYRNNKKRYQLVGKRQLNVVISEGIVNIVKHLAKELQVPMAVLTEHSLQVAIYHLMKLKGDEKRTSVLQDHLVKDHLLNSGEKDYEELLKLGCERTYIEELLPLAARVFRSLDLLGKELDTVIHKYCTPKESDRIKKIKDINNKTMFDLVMWMKRLELRTDSIEKEQPVQREGNKDKSP